MYRFLITFPKFAVHPPELGKTLVTADRYQNETNNFRMRKENVAYLYNDILYEYKSIGDEHLTHAHITLLIQVKLG